MSLYYANVSAHFFAALLWLGGMFFLAAVGAPALRRVTPAGGAPRAPIACAGGNLGIKWQVRYR